MKNQIIVIALFLSCLATTGSAQVRVSINLNAQPVWGPVGYDRADYYYMPDIETYYSVSNRQYTYNDGGRWITSANLPPRYSNYDLYHGYKAVVNEPSPWFHNDRYRSQYGQYRGRHDQAFIRDSHDQRYYANPGHPQHNNWVQQHGNDGHREGGGYNHDNGRGNREQGGGNGHGNEYRGDHRDNQPHGNGNDRGNQGRGNGQGNQGHGNDRGGNAHEGRGNEGHGNDHHDH